MAARLSGGQRAGALPPAVLGVWDRLQAAGDTYLVGGAVRDLVLGRTPHDYDLATALSPDAAQALLGWKEGPGGRFGSLHAPGLPLEVVSLREESGYQDRRRPDTVRFGATLEVDLARRDFTVNAMAMRRDGHVIDPYGGRRDLMRRRLAAVGDPEVRLREDLLRVLRAYRFSAQLGFRISTALRATARRLAGELSQVASERVGEELWRLLDGPAALSALRRAERDGVLAAAAPWLHPTHPVQDRLARILAWTHGAQTEAVLAAAERFGWPRAARLALGRAYALRYAVLSTPERARWREELAAVGGDTAMLLVRAGGGARLQAFARMYGREGVVDRTRLPLRGQELARAHATEDREIGRLEREELRRLWRDPRSVL